MKPINFKEANKDLLKPANMTDEECGKTIEPSEEDYLNGEADILTGEWI